MPQSNIILVGSRALNCFDTKYLSSAKRQWDYDWIGTYESFLNYKAKLPGIKKATPLNRGKTIAIHTKSKVHEFEIAWDDSTAKELLDLAAAEPNDLVYDTGEYWVAKPNLIFALKKSHRFLRDSPHFLKTMLDYHHLRDRCDCHIPEVLEDWYKKRVKETYWYNHPNLDVSKKEFFKGDEIPYIYDHDSIHIAMAHLEKPAYEYYKADKVEVKCSKDLFQKLPEQVKLYGVLEESYVLALERSQIPAPGMWTPRKSFEVALQKVCSSITSGWFREYAYEHYFQVLNLYDDSYVEKFKAAVKSGIVKKLDEIS